MNKKEIEEIRERYVGIYSGDGVRVNCGNLRELLNHAEQLQELHEQVAQMCEYLGSKRDEVPCDSWHLRDLIMRLAPAEHERAALAEQAARLLRNHVAGENVDDPMHQWADEWDHVVAQPGADRAAR